MPKVPAKFEDWTPPWKEGEIDEATVARLVYNLQLSEQDLTADKRKLKTENEELTSANEVFKAASDESSKSHDDATKKAVAEAVAPLQKENEQLKEKLSDNARETDLLKVRVEYPKIDDEDIERLKGKDIDELLEDAKKFAEKHGLVADPDDPDDDGQEDNSDLRRQPRPKRTPGDPDSRGAPKDDLTGYLERRAAKGQFG